MSIDINSAWNELRERVASCKKCELCTTRHNTVFGEGPVENCKCVIVGEAPGEDEDNTGRPFVGKAGKLLTDILEKGGGIPRGSIYITNVIKCRPPGNSDPSSPQMLACSEYLEAQLLLLKPSVIVSMGRISTRWLLKASEGIGQLRGKWIDWRGIKLLPMFHPSYLLRCETMGDKTPKYLTWNDVRALRTELDKI